MDNAKTDPQHRAAVLLLGSTGDTARIRFVGFPSDLASDRFDVKEIARELQTRWTRGSGAAR
ncbi:MAG TPA: hypothetical protein VMW35_02110 [Myxococcota bacterium]|nr:hypothetical protein [Myxococcota bacterium]